jgi:penicillin-binding protein 2
MRAALQPVTGTGRRAANPNYDFGGKTGTAQVASTAASGPEEERPEALRNHAWFVGIAPIESPEIAIVVFIEHGVGGGVTAAPIAGQLMTAYFETREEAKQ